MAAVDPKDPGQSKKTVRTFAFASFLNDMGSDIIYPIWPLFIMTFGLGKDEMKVLGLIDGLGDAIVSISQAISGYISDRIRKRKVFIWTGYAFAALSRLGYAVTTGWKGLIPFKVLDRAGKMRGSPRDAIIADVSTDENRGRNFGILKAMDNLGAVCGILVCLVLFGHFAVSFQTLFIIAAVPSLIGVVMIMIEVKEPMDSTRKIFKGLRVRHLDANFRFFLILSVIFSLGAFSYSFLIVYAKKVGFSTSEVIILYLIYNAVATLVAFPFGKLADKAGRKAVLQIGFALWALTCAVALFDIYFGLGRETVIGYAAMVALFVCYGLHKSALEPVQKAFVSEIVPVEYRASGLGVYQMFVGLAALPGSVIPGYLWDKYGVEAAFLFAFALAVGAVMLMTFVKDRRGGASPGP